ncbi:unnamed protein product [Rangifer tarandus platyrhynchus]|uniref:Uncharacterized protein n=2 Tax=Rangifer tarandus platyrhynchus TaxID=3082113 RepID=A0ABN8ZL62_RANTA|nr:unnamed protein product [Rangifer tarandus platyrhynchus]
MDCSPPGSSVHGDSQSKNTGGLPCPSSEDLPNPGIESRSPALQADSLPSEPPGKPIYPFRRGRQERQRQKKMGRQKQRLEWDIWKMEEVDANQGVQVASRSWKSQGNRETDSPVKPPEGTQGCQHCSFRLLNLQNCKRINLSHFKALSLW